MTIHNIKRFVFQEKTPLALLVLSQAYTMFLWFVNWNVQAYPTLTVLIAIITAVSLDSVVVSTTFSKHRSSWTLFTAVVAALSSVMIALDLYYSLHFWWLHASFPVLVFFYSNHLSAEKILASESGEQNGNAGNKEDLVNRILDIFGDDTPDYKVAKIIGGKTKTSLELIKEIKRLRQEQTGNNGNDSGINGNN